MRAAEETAPKFVSQGSIIVSRGAHTDTKLPVEDKSPPRWRVGTSSTRFKHAERLHSDSGATAGMSSGFFKLCPGKPPRYGVTKKVRKTTKRTLSGEENVRAVPAIEKPLYTIGDFAFGSWLEMAAKKGRQDPKQLMPAISGIVDDMNNMRAGKTFRSRAASDFAWAMEGVQTVKAWLQTDDVLPLRTVCKAFVEGREKATFQHLSVRGNQPVSLDQIANLSPPDMARLLKEYLGNISVLLPQISTRTLPAPPPQARDSSADNQKDAETACIRLSKESTALRLAHVIGRPSNLHSYAEQTSASVPTEKLQQFIEVGAFTKDQASKMWDCWYLVCAHMLHLKAEEVALQARAQTAAEHAVAFPDRISNYCNLLTTAADLKRNLEQQANYVFRFNCQVGMAIMRPWQAIMCQEAVNPSPMRPHLLFLSGLFPKLHPSKNEAALTLPGSRPEVASKQ